MDFPETSSQQENPDPEMTLIAEDRLDAMGTSIAERRDEWIQAKQASGIEKRWIDDLDQYLGRDEATKQTATMMDSAEAGFPITNKGGKPQRSTVFVNITRPKTNTAESRLANMLLPTDDRNFGLKPSPVPELTLLAKKQAEALAQGMQPPAPPAPAPAAPGQPPVAPTGPAPAQPLVDGYQSIDAASQIEEAAACTKAMQDEVDDQLQECGYNGECRKLIHDAAVLGTGVMHGPIIINRMKKSWTPMTDAGQTIHVIEFLKETKPASECVSPWDILTDPSCGNDPHAGQGIFRKRAYTSKQLRDLVKQPGYIKANISKVLEQGPQLPDYMSERDKRDLKSKGSLSFECWEYWGEFTPEDLQSAGVEVDEGSTDLVSGCVIIFNDVVIKGFLNPHESGEIPFDFFVWEADSNSVWGYGVPFLCRPAQRVLNAAWRQLMDNSGLSVGPQIVVNRRAVTPMDGRWEITGRKLWDLTDTTITDVRQVFSSIEFNNHGEEIQQIINLALKFVDLETSVPQLEQGEHANAPETLGGMIIQQNSTNIVLGRLTKCFDDNITSKHIARYVDWNMAYNPKPEIKGDHNIVARGTSALLVRDIQNQALVNLGKFQNAPLIAPMVRWEEWFKECLRAQHIDPATLMKSEAEIASIAQQQSPPPIQVQVEQAKGQNTLQAIQAKAQSDLAQSQQELAHEQQMLVQGGASPHMASANARIETAKIKAESDAGEMQVKARTEIMVETSRAHAEAARADKELEIAQQNGQFKIQELQLQKEIAILQYSTQQKISLDAAKAQLAKSAMDNSTKRQLAAAEIQLSQTESAHNRALDLHKHNTSLVRDEISTPNTP